MGTVTYPERSVAQLIEERFVACQIDVTDESSAAVTQQYRQAWTPDVRILDQDGTELYQWYGFLPPIEFIPRLLAGEAHTYLRLGDPKRAVDVYDEILTKFPTGDAAPEAQYFRAAAAYKASGEAEELQDEWEQLQRRYPESIWRVKQSMIEG